LGSLLDFYKYCLHIVHYHPSVLLDSYLPLSHIIVGSQVLSYDHFALIVLLYWPSLFGTLLDVDSLQALSFWSPLCLRVTILFCYPREGHLQSRQWSLQLEVLTPMEGVSLNIGTRDSSSTSRVSDEVVRPRSFTLFNCPVFSDLCDQGVLHRFLVLPLRS
jgi:hypothetical protein